MVPEGPRKSTAPLARLGVAEAPLDEEREKVMSKALVTDSVLLTALITAESAWGVGDDVTGGIVAADPGGFAEPQAASPVTARVVAATTIAADRVGYLIGSGIRARWLLRPIGE